jgi:hypothetical protein
MESETTSTRISTPADYFNLDEEKKPVAVPHKSPSMTIKSSDVKKLVENSHKKNLDSEFQK